MEPPKILGRNLKTPAAIAPQSSHNPKTSSSLREFRNRPVSLISPERRSSNDNLVPKLLPRSESPEFELATPPSSPELIDSFGLGDDEIEVTETLDQELQLLFQSMVNAQEDYGYLKEAQPKDPSRESKEKLSQVLQLIDRQLLIHEFNLEEMQKRKLKSLYGMTRQQIIDILDHVTALKTEILQYVTAELPRSKVVVLPAKAPVLSKRKCHCCTATETELNPLYKTQNELFCSDCYKIILPEAKLPLPDIQEQLAQTEVRSNDLETLSYLKSLDNSSQPTSSQTFFVKDEPSPLTPENKSLHCAICQKSSSVLRLYESVWICQSCDELVKYSAQGDNSAYLCPICDSDRTSSEIGSETNICHTCFAHFRSTTQLKLKKQNVSFAVNTVKPIPPVRLSPVSLDVTGKCCPLCYSENITIINQLGDVFCNGTCGQVIGNVANIRTTGPRSVTPKACEKCHSVEIIAFRDPTDQATSLTLTRFVCQKCNHCLSLPLSVICGQCRQAVGGSYLLGQDYFCFACQQAKIKATNKVVHLKDADPAPIHRLNPRYFDHFRRFQEYFSSKRMSNVAMQFIIENNYTGFQTEIGSDPESQFYSSLLNSLPPINLPRIVICYYSTQTVAYSIPPKTEAIKETTVDKHTFERVYTEVINQVYQKRALKSCELIEFYSGFPQNRSLNDFSVVCSTNVQCLFVSLYIGEQLSQVNCF